MKIEKFFKNSGIWILILGVIGVLLLILPGFFESKSEKNTDENTAVFYSETLENKIEKLCTGVDGINEARVLVTLESGSEFIYAANSEKKDSSSGTSTVRDYLIVEKNSGEEPVAVSEIYPKIRGVAVVCTGGDNPAVQEKITGLISAALGVSANRIRVVGGG